MSIISKLELVVTCGDNCPICNERCIVTIVGFVQDIWCVETIKFFCRDHGPWLKSVNIGEEIRGRIGFDAWESVTESHALVRQQASIKADEKT